MFNLILRNILVFFKDKTTVILSFFAEFIIIALYFLFIRKNLTESFIYIKDIEILLDCWMVGGLLGIASITTTMCAYGIMVDDKASNIRKDFLTSPIRQYSLLGGYMGSAIIIGLVTSLLVLVVSAIYLYNKYQITISIEQVSTICLEIVITTVTNSSLVLLLVSFLKSSNALAACCTILSSLVGFVTGIYLPLGSLPNYVQWIVKCFPTSHGVSLIRQSILDSLLINSFGSKSNLAATNFIDYMGVKFTTAYTNYSVLALTAILGTLLAVFNLSLSLSNNRK